MAISRVFWLVLLHYCGTGIHSKLGILEIILLWGNILFANQIFEVRKLFRDT